MATTGTRGRSRLERLPSELADIIAEYLDLPALCNLRLCRKAFSTGRYSLRFQSFFKDLHTHLTFPSLDQLREIAEDPVLGSAVQSLTVLAVVFDAAPLSRMLQTKRRRHHENNPKSGYDIKELPATEDELEEARLGLKLILTEEQDQREMSFDKSDLQILTRTLKALGTLKILKIEGAVAQGGGFFDTPYSGRDGIAIEHLDIYNGRRRCSVQTWDINDFMPELESAEFAKAAIHIRSFSISFSPRVESDFKKILDARATTYTGVLSAAGLLSEQDPSVVAEENYPGIARLLKHMPNLEQLDLHMYRMLEGSVNSYAKVFSYIANDVVLPSLRHCVLRGLRSNTDSLLKFFKNHNEIETIELREVHLVAGIWRPVLEHLCTLPSLQQVVLQDIARGGKYIRIAPKHRVQQDDGEDHHNPYAFLDRHTRTFSREEIQKEKFEFAKGPKHGPLSPRDALIWREAREVQYGPPEFHQVITMIPIGSLSIR